ncbi:MAG TPA: type II toxin-antitoxin system PrlF family antitoxin [Terracidiphilus sp.]|nr:type II toxin-antitoxin system PrlF family antitoxin [Terracidiphilus sp.]
MPAIKDKKSAAPTSFAVYRGRRAQTGNSSGFRFEGALFKSHPEFNGEVKAQVISPGRMLVTAESGTREATDPVMASFLAFLGSDIASHPEKVSPLDENLVRSASKLTKGVVVDPEEDLGGQDIL